MREEYEKIRLSAIAYHVPVAASALHLANEPGGWLVLEHPPTISADDHADNCDCADPLGGINPNTENEGRACHETTRILGVTLASPGNTSIEQQAIQCAQAHGSRRLRIDSGYDVSASFEEQASLEGFGGTSTDVSAFIESEDETGVQCGSEGQADFHSPNAISETDSELCTDARMTYQLSLN